MEMNGKKKAAVSMALMFLALAAFCAEKPKSEKLLAALSSLEKLEKALPAESAPSASIDDAERMKRAKAFFDAGRACHDLMGQFGERLGKKADRYLRASLAYRESSVTRVYLGSSHLIQARDAANVITKVSEVNIGLKETDAAVKSAPDDILTRAVRIECCISLPPMFKRLDTVTEDLAILLKVYAEKPQAFEGVYSPARLFQLKAAELEQRGKNSLAEKYREKAKRLSAGGAS
jgi:hypothetical protein